MTIFLTGVAGFIGSNVSKYLLSQGHNVIGIDNFDPFYPRHFKEYNMKDLLDSERFDFFEEDIRNKEALKDIFDSNKIDMVIHLAAKAGVRPSIEKIGEYYDVNINGTIAILETMKEFGVKKMLFASSSSVYGNNKKVPFSETDIVDNPISPYAATKKSGELLCHVYCSLYKFEISCLRFFTVFGPGQRPDLAIHKFTRLIDTDKSIPFFGDGTTARDYTYIDDIVHGVICAMDNIKGYNVFNLGESRVVTLEKLIRTIEDAMKKKAILNKLPMQQGDVEKTYADITKAKAELGYNPMQDLDAGIQKFVNWYLENKHQLYRSVVSA